MSQNGQTHFWDIIHLRVKKGYSDLFHQSYHLLIYIYSFLSQNKHSTLILVVFILWHFIYF